MEYDGWRLTAVVSVRSSDLLDITHPSLPLFSPSHVFCHHPNQQIFAVFEFEVETTTTRWKVCWSEIRLYDNRSAHACTQNSKSGGWRSGLLFCGVTVEAAHDVHILNTSLTSPDHLQLLISPPPYFSSTALSHLVQDVSTRYISCLLEQWMQESFLFQNDCFLIRWGVGEWGVGGEVGGLVSVLTLNVNTSRQGWCEMVTGEDARLEVSVVPQPLGGVGGGGVVWVIRNRRLGEGEQRGWLSKWLQHSQNEPPQAPHETSKIILQRKSPWLRPELCFKNSIFKQKLGSFQMLQLQEHTPLFTTFLMHESEKEPKK